MFSLSPGNGKYSTTSLVFYGVGEPWKWNTTQKNIKLTMYKCQAQAWDG